MIHVVQAPQPARFDADVRQPGQAEVRRYTAELAVWEAAGRPSGQKPQPLEPHWRRCIEDLKQAYHRVCAYSCFYIHPVTGAGTVEHLAPKSKAPEQAYEWSNYRLVCSLMNSRKNDFEDVLDPFEIEHGWFQLDFIQFQVWPNQDLGNADQRRVQDTIDRLKLNDSLCCDAREKDYQLYADGLMSWELLQAMNPFVAAEAERLGMR